MPKISRKMSHTAQKNESNIDTPSTTKKTAWETLAGGSGNCEIVISDKSKIVLTLTKNPDTNEVFLDIRQWVDTPKYTGLTQKGVSIRFDYVDEFLDKVNELIKYEDIPQF